MTKRQASNQSDVNYAIEYKHQKAIHLSNTIQACCRIYINNHSNCFTLFLNRYFHIIIIPLTSDGMTHHKNKIIAYNGTTCSGQMTQVE